MSRCEYPRCRQENDLIYYGHAICQKHYELHCNKEINLKEIFKISEKKQTTLTGGKI